MSDVDDVNDSLRSSWGFPSFARSFPEDARLDALVTAFANGDYATVRGGVEKLLVTCDDEEIRRSAMLLRERTKPDRTASIFFVLTAGLLVFLTVWWVTHDGPDHGAPPNAPRTSATPSETTPTR